MSEHKSPIPSRIYNAATGGHICGTEDIIDDTKNKTQKQINSEVEESLGTGGSVDSRIASAVATETTRAQTAEEQLRQAYEALSQSQPIPVTELPATGEAGKIYRLAGTTSYADYMYAEGALTTPIKMAEYDNAIDDEPTAGSNNLIKSKGVSEAIDNSKLLYGNKIAPYIDGGFIYSADGEKYTNSEYCYSEKVEVKSGQLIHALVACSAAAAAIAFYSADGTFISSVAGDTDETVLDNYYALVPENVAYIRTSTGMSKKNDSYFEIVFGSTKQMIDSVTGKPLNNIVLESTIFGGYITNETGIIVSQGNTSEYKHIKVHLNKGLYLIDLMYLGSQSILAKYTDSNYNTLDRIIIGNRNGRVNECLFLEEGYYVLGWMSGNGYYITNDASLIFFGNILEKVSLKTIGEKIAGMYITDNGDIAPAGNDYNLIKTYLNAGYYLIELDWNSHPKGALYTDNTYNTYLETVILPNAEKTKKIFYLNSGYYAFCALDVSVIPFDCIIEQFPSLFVYGSQQYGKYIADGTGIITAADISYVLTKIFLKGKYHIQIPQNGTHPKMWKYTDSTYGTPSEPVFDSSNVPVDAFVELNGYYAICNLISYGVPVITKLQDNADIVHNARLWNRGNNKAFTSIGLKDLIIYRGGIFSDGNLVLTASGETTGYAYLTDFQCWYWRMAAKILVTNEMNIEIGKFSGGSESFLFTLNADGSYIFELSSEISTGTVDIDFSVGENISIVLIGETAATKTAKVQVINARGNVFEILRSDGQWSMFGQPGINTTTNCTITDFSLDVQNYYDMKNLKVVMWGHSFVEANSLVTDKMQCFTSLLGNTIGEDKVVNFGRGGFSIYNVQRAMETADKLFHNADYFIFCIGANDTTQTSDYIIEKLMLLIQMTEELGITPILMTISPPKSGQLASFVAVNAWIRNSGYKYVDMEKVFLNVDGTINNEVYLDDLHPNVAGHLAIYNRIQLDCPWLF